MNHKLELELHKNDLSMDSDGLLGNTVTSLGLNLYKLKHMWDMSEAEVVEKLASDAVIKAERRHKKTGSFCKPIKASPLH
ncbi:hypothetical protein [Massilia cavernae]|uniref:Uncharacterized protein n=1 Tax=Massilia cavernae TaxID=2320864 RepID=A0A418XFY8_9BURK|nr:hypothetical protein [Massilia cavernae]RJG11371.1 hypothetical protein D3872_19780 [Massilia cavernae]